MVTDPLSFLDEPEKDDPLSFLDETPTLEQKTKGFLSPEHRKKYPMSVDRAEEDPLSFLDEPETEEDTAWNRAKNYFTKGKFGEALVLQTKSGGFAGAPALSPEAAKRVAVEVGTIAAVEAAFIPILGAAAAAPFAPKVIEAIARLTRSGSTGAAVGTTLKLAQEGEFPTSEELINDAATWILIDSILQGAELGFEFGGAVNRIAKDEGVPAYKVLQRLWQVSKEKIKQKFNHIIDSPEKIRPEDVEILVDEVKKAEKNGMSDVEIDITPKQKQIEGREKVAIGHEEKPQIEHKPKEVVVEKKPKIKPSEELSKEELVSEIEKTRDIDKEIIERTLGKGTYEEYKNAGFEGRRKFWEKNGDKFSEKDIKTIESEPYDDLDLTRRLRELDIDIKTSYYSGESSRESISNVIGDIRGALIRIDEPGNKNLIQNALDFLVEKGHSKEEIAKGVFEVIKRDLKSSDAEMVLKEIFGGKEKPVEQPKPVEIEKAKEIVEQKPELPQEKISEIKRQDISPAGLKQQKQYLLNEIENALTTPSQESQVTFDVPGDGEFTINNNEVALTKFKEAVEKNWPDKPLRKGGGKKKYAQIPASGYVKEEPIEKPAKPKPKKTRKQVLQAKAEKFYHPKTQPLHPVIGKKQAVARSKILKVFRKAFLDPIRMGKLGMRKALGNHKMWSKVTRLLRDNDIEVAAHEIGHNLHTILYGGNAGDAKTQRANVINHLKPYLNELRPLGGYEPFTLEGFAEFTRLYVTNPQVALDLAPKFYAKFEADLDAQYPELKNALLEARDYYDQYLQGTPQSRIRAQTSYASDRGRLDKLVSWAKDNFSLDKKMTELIDDVFPAKRLVAEAFGIPLSEVENLKDSRNLYRSLRLLKGAVGKADVFVLHQTFNPITLQKINGSLKDILKQLPDEESIKEFNDYLIARRSVEKQAQKVDTGINLGDAIYVERQLEPKYGKLAKKLDRYNDSLLRYAVEAGLISEKQYSDIKKNNLMYVPFQRVMEKEKTKGVSGAGSKQARKSIFRMKGSHKDIISPIESVLKNTYNIIMNAEKNLSGKVLAELSNMKNVGRFVEKVPIPIELKAKVHREEIERSVIKHLKDTGQYHLLEQDQNGKWVLQPDFEDIIPDLIMKFGPTTYPAGENIVTVYNEGKPTYYEVSPEIFEMWQKGITPYTADLLTKILRVPARWLRAGAILNPKFWEKNIIRDTWGSYVFSKYGKTIKEPMGLLEDILYTPIGMAARAAGQSKLYVEYLKAGGGMATMQGLDRDTVAAKLKEVRDGYKPYQLIKWLREFASITEEANRLAEFSRALEVEGHTKLGKEIAAFAARDLSVDFAKMGLMVKALNQIVPFFNATLQGGDKLIRTMGNKEDRNNFLPKVIAFLVIPSLILAWLNRDDENVKEFYEEEKDFNFIFNVGGKYIKIPVPFETGVLAHGITRRMFDYFIKKDPEAFEGFMGSIKDAMLPNFIPTAGNPLIETYANKNFFTGARIIPADKEDLISKYQYKNNTSSSARLIGRAMAYMLGQETRSKAASPAVIDHFINSWTGGLGRLTIAISDTVLEQSGLVDKIPGPKETIVEKYGLDGFSTRYPRASTRSIEKFYDNYQDATARQKSFKYAEKMDLEGKEDQEEAYKRYDKIYDYPTLQKAYKAIQNCQREINNIWNDPTMEPEIKKTYIDNLYLQQIQFAKDANEDIRKYRLTQKD